METIADKQISDLVEATSIQAGDLYVLEQGGVAKKLLGQTLINWLTSYADGHGGIQSISIVDSGTPRDGAMHTATIHYADTTTSTFTYYDGLKGDTGDASYMHIKYAAEMPTSDADMGNTPDNWIGVYSGTSESPPEHYESYEWFKWKGDPGQANIPTTEISYQAGTSATTPPVGSWQTTPPSVAPGLYLWTRVYTTFSQGGLPSTVYSVARQGVDGAGAAGTQTPLMDGSADVGTSTSFAREDHRHPTDTSRAAATDVEAVNGKIVTLGGGKAVFVGDSYSSTATGYTRALPEMLGEILKLDAVYNYAIPGAGYVNGIGTSQHFGGQLASAIADLADQADDIAYVFVLGGQNDYAQTVNDIATQADALFAAAKAAFPRAQIVALPLWYNRALSEANALRYTVIYYHAIANGCLTDTLSWAYLITTATQMMQDGVHPQETSLFYLASCIANAVRGCQTVLPLSSGVVSWSSAVGGTLAVTGNAASCATYANGVVSMHILWSGSSTGIPASSNIFRVNPVFVPTTGCFLYAKLSNGGNCQVTFGANGYAYNSTAIPANTNLEIDVSWSLYSSAMTTF